MLRMLIVSVLLVTKVNAFSQVSPIAWNFEVDSVQSNTATIVLEANLVDGWRIYSHYMAEGGPIPTSIKLDTEGGCVASGETFEVGKVKTYYNSVYGMQIAWYSDTVKFLQKVEFKNSTEVLRGMIQYMICDGHVRIPGRQPFSIRVKNR